LPIIAFSAFCVREIVNYVIIRQTESEVVYFLPPPKFCRHMLVGSLASLWWNRLCKEQSCLRTETKTNEQCTGS